MDILGVRVDDLDIGEVLQKIEGFLNDGRQHYIVTPNPDFLIKAKRDSEFSNILNQADLSVPDGIGLIFASWFLGRPIKKRVTGVDLMERICQKSAEKRWPVFLIGGGEGVAEKAAKNLMDKYRASNGWQVFSGRPESVDFDLILNNSAPTIIFVALGAPKQEKWIVQNLTRMPFVKLAVGVGGAFDFIAGEVRRAPKFLRIIGMEWLWRLMMQPWRLRRIFNSVVKFPWLMLKSRI